MSTPVRPTAAAPASPRTPQRGISSTFSSPGFRTEEESIIFEFGARYFRAGLAGDSAPRCVLNFGPEESRRVGDYRKWLPGYEERIRPIRPLETWGKDRQLWELDSREFDLGLAEDKIERAVRTAYTKFLLLDTKARKAVLVVPKLIAHPLLARILNVLFTNFQMPSITLVPPPTMCVVAAGQRSGVVVDIGWHESTITIVYELREIAQYKTTRAMKLLMQETATLLEKFAFPRRKEQEQIEKLSLDFDYVEELMTQIIWCQPSPGSRHENGTAHVYTAYDSEQQQREDKDVLVRLPLPSSRPVKIPFSSLNRPVETALFANARFHREQDDHEHALDYLLHESLLQLDLDVRSVCVSRIMFTGGGASIPGLKARLLDDLGRMVKTRDWNPVWGRAADEHLAKQVEMASLRSRRDGGSVTTGRSNTLPSTDNEEPKIRAAFQENPSDPIDEKLRREENKGAKPTVNGVIRGIETLGPWAGASLTAALRIKSLVEIDREIYLQHGLTGPKRDSEILTSRPKSYSGALGRAGMQDTGSWTLGAWA
jgi:actin-related protein